MYFLSLKGVGMVSKELQCPLCNSHDILLKQSKKNTETGKIVVVARCQVCQSTFLHEDEMQEEDSACE